MRKIASHYYLKPDGKLGKYPILTFNDDNELVEIGERNIFSEEEGLELINGLLIPSFVNIIPKVNSNSIDVYERIIKYQKINGVSVLGVDELDIQIFNEKVNEKLFIKGYPDHQQKRHFVINIFDEMRENKSGLNEILLYTYLNAIELKVQKEFGSLEVNKRPGLLAISAMNYKDFTLTKNSKLKIIV